MARILLVDNDQDWLDLIGGSLPDYEVEMVRSYKAAVRAIRSGTTYDVAIVDLNLIDSPNRSTLDDLGGKFLDKLRKECPETRRIALTAYTPSNVKRVLDKYVVDDLLLKANMALSVVPEVVQAALALTSAELPPGARARRSELRQDLDRWQQDQAMRLDQQLQRLRNDLAGSALLSGGAKAARTATARKTRLDALEARREFFDRECARVAAIVNGIGSADNVSVEQAAIDDLKREFGAEEP